MIESLSTLIGPFHIKMLGVLLNATQWTVYLSLTAFIGGGLIGLIFTLLRITPINWIRKLAVAYIWTFQSIPLLMLLFLTGLGIPIFYQINVPPWVAATISLTLFTSAYMSEVWRGALQSINIGQWKAGRALGLGFVNNLRYVIAPQALKIATPPTVGFMVQVIKGTSLAYIIDFNDLMRWGKKIGNSQIDGAEPFIVFPLVALIYFFLCFPLTLLSRRLEQSLNVDSKKLMLTINKGG